MDKVQCRWAPSLGALEDTHQNVWGTIPYTDRNKPCVWFGMYDLRDYLALWRHKGKKYILWAGSDIRNLMSGFMTNDGKLRWLSLLIKKLPSGFQQWTAFQLVHTLREAENWVENDLEAAELGKFDIECKVCPSYLGNVNLPVTYKWQKRMEVFVSSGADRQEEYGFGVVERIAGELPWVTFHLYGASWKSKHLNVIVHGRVLKDRMNRETATMQVGLRLNEFDGFSEILAKAVLRGQYAVGKVAYPMIPSYENDLDLILKLNRLRREVQPNLKVREFYRSKLNEYPWVSKNH